MWSQRLRPGLSPSCGCANKTGGNPLDLSIVDTQIGPFFVIAYSHSDKGRSPKFRVRCSCGRESVVYRRDIYRNKSCLLCSWENARVLVGRMAKWYFNTIKAQAKARGIQFDVSAEYLSQLFDSQGGLCAYSKEPLTFSPVNNRETQTASVDRIDSNKGYAEGNVQWVHRDVNYMKQSLTEERFVGLCNRIAAYHPQVENKSPGECDNGRRFRRKSKVDPSSSCCSGTA